LPALRARCAARGAGDQARAGLSRDRSARHPRLANRIAQFEHLERRSRAPLRVALCCLGTTIRQAGSQQSFRAVDVDCVLAFAARRKSGERPALRRHIERGADPGARILPAHQGEMEQRLVEAGFESLDILQPSLLLGWRGEVRPLELAARAFTRW